MPRKPSSVDTQKNNRVTIRLNESEKALLNREAERAGLSKANFIRKLIGDKKTFLVVDRELLALIIRELSAQGNNLNQAVYALHTALPDLEINGSDTKAVAAIEGLEALRGSLADVYKAALEFMSNTAEA